MSGLLVHEWIEQRGGSEKVLEAFSEIFPEADIACLWTDDRTRFANRNLKESWLAKTPLKRSKPLALPFMPTTWQTVDTSNYDWTLASSHLFAHHVARRREVPGTTHFAYIHTPARYIWEHELDMRGNSKAAALVRPLLKYVDKRAAARTHHFAANSIFVQQRIERCWDRPADVIYPPVEVKRIQERIKSLSGQEERILNTLPDQFILGASRFVPYKRLDVAIDAGVASGLPVVIAGSGPEASTLKHKAEGARIPVRFVESPSDALLYELYERALVYVFPSIEDFGIMPVEAMACGTPVIVNSSGGANETVQTPVGGFALSTFNNSTLKEAIEHCSGLDREVIALHSHSFSREIFERKIRTWIETNCK